MNYIQRPLYLEFLRRHRDHQIIKVVSGVRRAGKSVLFQLFKEELLKEGIAEEQIISINFEDLTFYDLRDFKVLYAYIKERLYENKKHYIFLDEIQHVDQFELVADSLFIDPNIDLYLTGSNAYFMSGQLATNLTGRYVEIEVLPLSFEEYLAGKELTEQNSRVGHFNDYLFSAFPYLLQTSTYMEKIDYLRGIYNSILLNDIVSRLGNPNPAVIERIVRVLLSSVGSLISTNKIRNTLISQGVSLSHATLENYLTALTDSLLFYAVPRFDVKGRALLQRLEKYYAVDLGFRSLLLPDHKEDAGHMLENIVYLELRRRYPHVYVGNVDKYEVDFVAVTDLGHYAYYQVSETTLAPETLARELRPLEEIKDQFPKYLLTMDTIQPSANYNGIEKKNIIDWLLETDKKES
ncbi:ATP-binding protein [Streptococcus mutans]|jgi:Predicted ATPase (AAA+ superfamily)|uniref:ATP-binding protein n=1 Tax=Streptococcus mutans TaxID=1309 RepID=UPI0002B4E70C|nr:ATP-binding protein [Streptococcus mutans]EMB75954.1 ATPase [Streptococcus mutans 15VF2]EMC02238.1 ATPase [Streptococcus mutans NFSM1]MCB4949582.1 ATP-binding protein [Streptococcus mutans]MCB4960712.1 ATP-binding protein [Streptococcus mutans]MCB5078447.1 ATP-binding protein [Streptococcus mutans]